jgi:ParB family chromosome partitioning protein
MNLIDTNDMLVSDIIVGPRHRQDLGDITALAKSIQAIGLLQPLVVTENGNLIAGRRRLEAIRELGRTRVAVRVIRGDEDPLKALLAERDENTCRKDFTLSEALAIGKAIEDREREAAKKRQQATRAKGKDENGTPTIGGGKLPPPKSDKGKTRDKVAQVVGMSGRSYEKARQVAEAAKEDPELFGPIRDEMIKTGKIDPAHREVKKKRSRDEIVASWNQQPGETATTWRQRLAAVGSRRRRDARAFSWISCTRHIAKKVRKHSGVKSANSSPFPTRPSCSLTCWCVAANRGQKSPGPSSQMCFALAYSAWGTRKRRRGRGRVNHAFL